MREDDSNHRTCRYKQLIYTLTPQRIVSVETIEQWAAAVVAKRAETWSEFRLLQLQKRYGTWFSLKPSIAPVEHRTMVEPRRLALRMEENATRRAARREEQAGAQRSDPEEDDDDTNDETGDDTSDDAGGESKALGAGTKPVKPSSRPKSVTSRSSSMGGKRMSSKRGAGAKAGVVKTHAAMNLDTMDRLR